MERRHRLLCVVALVFAVLLWSSVAPSSSTPPSEDSVLPPPHPQEPPQGTLAAEAPPPEGDAAPTAANDGGTDAHGVQPIRLSRSDGRLRCSAPRGNATCAQWYHHGWFTRSRDADVDGQYHPTQLRASEVRPLSPDANVTNDEDAVAAHDAAEWRDHWQLRNPRVRWSRDRAKNLRQSLPTEILEQRETNQLNHIRSTMAPKSLDDLEFIRNVPPLYRYLRPAPEARWLAMEQQLGSRPVRVACLYAGFARDVEPMYASCRDRKSDRACHNIYVNKRFGNMRDNIVEATNCDVYVSTWEIRGAGRYSTTTYNMADRFDPARLHAVYGPRLAGAHVQNFTQYQQLWRYMHKFSRPFPQTRPTKLHVNHATRESSWEGVPELNFYVRINDYSQSYKHWCVTHLALLSDVSYDLFFRLRLDLRVSSRVHGLMPILLHPPHPLAQQSAHAGERAVGFRLASAPFGGGRSLVHHQGNASALHTNATQSGEILRVVSANRIHVGNFDIADFGFLGPPFMIEELSRLWYYCIADPATPLAPFDLAKSITPKEMYSEYNLMLWRIIFDNKWTVDSGGRYLWVSRYGTARKQKAAKSFALVLYEYRLHNDKKGTDVVFDLMSRSLFCFCNDAVCVADNQHVVFYAPRTLRKFRVEKFTDHRVVGLRVTTSAEGSMLHVVDTAGNYVVVSVSNVTVQRSTTFHNPSHAGGAPSRPVVAARRGGKPVADGTAPISGVIQACFYEVGEGICDGGALGPIGALRCVLLTTDGVYDMSTTDASSSYLKYAFPRSLSGLTMDVGARSGVTVVGQQGQRWAYALPSGPYKGAAAPQLNFNVALQSIACHPEEASMAVGGARGELLVYPSIHDAHHFSEHWHHTPLQALCYSSDGFSLYTGASEGVVLTWNLSSYTFRKLGVHLGPIHVIATNVQNGTQLLLPCDDASLAVVDLLQQRVEKSIEGAQWTNGKGCTGIVVTNWMGQEAVILTGMPDVVRVCDPVTQQAFYSLHVRTQLETVAAPPDSGIKHVGTIGDGRVLVTYEEYQANALPSALRFWVYDSATKRHIEAQTVYSPHRSAVLAMCVDAQRQRVFTLSRGVVKCWAEVEGENRTDATADGLGVKRWKCIGSTATATSRVQSMALSEDGSVCMVADDTIYLYGVSAMTSGTEWPLLTQLTQDESTESLSHLFFDTPAKAIGGSNPSAAFVWSLDTGDVKSIVPPVGDVSPCRLVGSCHKRSTSTLVCAFTDGSVREVSVRDGTSTIATAPKGTMPPSLLFLRWLNTGRFAVVDAQDGYRTLQVTLDAQKTRVEPVMLALHQASSSGEDPNVERSANLQHYFRNPVRHLSGNSDQDSDTERYARAAQSKQWLSDVLDAAPYTAPPVSAVLHAYLQNLHGNY